ncbi:MAG: tail completion protein gp17 [Ktedonobacterales bacterium]
MANEALHVYQWLYATLHGDATLMSAATGVFAGAAPDGTAPPYVVYNWQGGTDVATVNGRRIMNNSLYQIKAVGPTAQIATLQTIADRIDTLLQRASGTAAGANILFCDRQYPLVITNTVNGTLWVNVGGLYRIYAQ